MHARYIPSRTVSYDLFKAISRREGRETAFVCILDPLSRAIRSKKKTSRLCAARRCSPIIRQPQKLQSRASLAFSLSLSTSLQLHSGLLHAIYNTTKEKETDTSLCFCRRDSEWSSQSSSWSNVIYSTYRNLLVL